MPARSISGDIHHERLSECNHSDHTFPSPHRFLPSDWSRSACPVRLMQRPLSGSTSLLAAEFSVTLRRIASSWYSNDSYEFSAPLATPTFFNNSSNDSNNNSGYDRDNNNHYNNDHDTDKTKSINIRNTIILLLLLILIVVIIVVRIRQW